jgi:hypothetical protein
MILVDTDHATFLESPSSQKVAFRSAKGHAPKVAFRSAKGHAPKSRLSLRERACFRGAKTDTETPRASPPTTLKGNLLWNQAQRSGGVLA